uniref:Uncharacterized protein n=1 Tax=Brassica oleracea var. oleracea TaxID=109376 RepID=A0A0D3AXU4_BRAOL
MEVFGKSPMVSSANVIYLSAILGRDCDASHKCDWKCENENVFGNMYRCKLTGLTHVCDNNCNQRILYDNHTSLCRASGRVFPLSPAEEQAVRGVRRKLDNSESLPPTEGCSFKRRRRDVSQFKASPFERSFTAAGFYSSCVSLFWLASYHYEGPNTPLVMSVLMWFCSVGSSTLGFIQWQHKLMLPND